MREIRFRGKHIETGELVHGYLIGNDVIVGKIVEWDDQYFCTEFWNKVDPETVGQYTGLKDKNGKEIYEGDVLANGTHINWVVIYDEASFKVKFPDPINTDRYELKRWMGESREIIGNIHDNPELIQ